MHRGGFTTRAKTVSIRRQMKYYFTLIAVPLLLLPLGVEAQEDDARWLTVVDRLDLVRLYQSGRPLLAEGFVPVAFDLSDDGLAHVVFSTDLDFEVDSWRIEVFDDPAEVNEVGGELVDTEWLPMDITVYGDQLALLLVRGSVTADAWGISRYADEPEAIQTVAENAAESGLSIFGLTEDADTIWYLLVRPSDPFFDSLTVVSMGTDEFYEVTNRRVTRGEMPVSLYFKGSTVNVVFVK